MKYTIYNETTGKILRTVDCPENMIDVQLQSDEKYVEGSCDDITQKVDGGIIVDKSQTELDDYNFKQVENTIPKLNTALDDIDLNAFINDYFVGKVDVEQWRIDNYAVLRKWSYPKLEVFLDAMVKINSKDVSLATEGQAQLDKYYTDCLAVKTRFVKESLTIIEEK